MIHDSLSLDDYLRRHPVNEARVEQIRLELLAALAAEDSAEPAPEE